MLQLLFLLFTVFFFTDFSDFCVSDLSVFFFPPLFVVLHVFAGVVYLCLMVLLWVGGSVFSVSILSCLSLILLWSCWFDSVTIFNAVATFTDFFKPLVCYCGIGFPLFADFAYVWFHLISTDLFVLWKDLYLFLFLFFNSLVGFLLTFFLVSRLLLCLLCFGIRGSLLLLLDLTLIFSDFLCLRLFLFLPLLLCYYGSTFSVLAVFLPVIVLLCLPVSLCFGSHGFSMCDNFSTILW